ncbi:hypothetical protein IVB33_30220 [Bradyrhizobium sp. 24]|uniref:hypothetical protein n=1 Tax=unclassified Bradyrhizobium TaxID=2631580 RepID=UPI001FFBF107|nr:MULTISPECIES: hypothetical protein [unclassified Bradyrhizobium]MCK1297516.1 hypothetical protein [Bradyrhizobium sp. 37]MCK1381169.1 hypothetical protein [Bradyrhizobium sp. 24]MCK1770920.1 hypothetical protein [Bradyrhizobium sp. 134]
MGKAPIDKSSAPEHIIGRTAWDVASETIGIVKLQASLVALVVVLVALSAVAIYFFYSKIAEQQQETIRRIHESGALLNQTADAMRNLRSAQISDLEKLFEVTRKATATYQDEQAKANEAKEKAAAAEAKEKEALGKVKDAEAKAAEAATKAKIAADSQEKQATTLSLTKSKLDQVKGSVLDLANSIREQNWAKAASNLDALFLTADSSFDQRIEQALGKLKSMEMSRSSSNSQSGVDASLFANPIAPPAIERLLSPTLIAQIQRVLCVDVDGVVGGEDSATRSALSQFFEGYENAPLLDQPRSQRDPRGARKPIVSPPLLPTSSPKQSSYILDTPQRMKAITAAVDKYESCDKHGFVDAFEVGLFTRFENKRINSTFLQAASLAKVSVPKPGKEWTNEDLRSVVKGLKDKYGLNSEDSEEQAGVISSELLGILRDVAQGRPYEAYLANYDPKVHANAYIESALRALCVPEAQYSSHRMVPALIDAYESGEGGAVRPDGVLDENELSSLVAMGPCPEGYRNAFERKAFPAGTVPEDVTKLLNRLSLGGDVPENASLKDLRDQVKVANHLTGMRYLIVPDQITKPLLDKLRKLVGR